MSAWFGRASAFAAALLMAGCLTTPAVPQGVMDRLRAVGGPQGQDVVVLEVALLEQSPGDSYLDSELWNSVDEQVVLLDRKAALDDNGLRVGVVGGLAPPKLDQLLRSERTNPSPHRITMRTANVKELIVGPTQNECSFELRLTGEPKPVKFPQAQFAFSITPARTEDGRVRLSLVPNVAHGGRTMWLKPADGEGWSLTGQRPTERFGELSFDVTISAQEYALIGTRFEREGTLGHAAFITAAGDRPNQRLLAIRARPQSPATSANPSDVSRATPLALQAARTTRGSRE